MVTGVAILGVVISRKMKYTFTSSDHMKIITVAAKAAQDAMEPSIHNTTT